jgi:hypothetical protein
MIKVVLIHDDMLLRLSICQFISELQYNLNFCHVRSESD